MYTKVHLISQASSHSFGTIDANQWGGYYYEPVIRNEGPLDATISSTDFGNKDLKIKLSFGQVESL